MNGWIDLMHARICTVTVYHSILCDDFRFNCSFLRVCVVFFLLNEWIWKLHFWISEMVFSRLAVVIACLASVLSLKRSRNVATDGHRLVAKGKRNLIDSDVSDDDDDDDMPNWSIWMWRWSCYPAIRFKYGWDIEFWSTQSSRVQFNSILLLAYHNIRIRILDFTKKKTHDTHTHTRLQNHITKWHGMDREKKRVNINNNKTTSPNPSEFNQWR